MPKYYQPRFVYQPFKVRLLDAERKPTANVVTISEETRFSVFTKPDEEDHKESLAILRRWVRWFNSRNIPAVLVEVPNFGRAVFREGLVQGTFEYWRDRGIKLKKKQFGGIR